MCVGVRGGQHDLAKAPPKKGKDTRVRQGGAGLCRGCGLARCRVCEAVSLEAQPVRTLLTSAEVISYSCLC